MATNNKATRTATAMLIYDVYSQFDPSMQGVAQYYVVDYEEHLGMSICNTELLQRTRGSIDDALEYAAALGYTHATHDGSGYDALSGGWDGLKRL